MTDVRTFRAANMQEAFQLVRRELGSDAIILHTRQIAERRLLPWLGQKKQVEITAGVGESLGELGQADVSTLAATATAEPIVAETTAVTPQSWTPEYESELEQGDSGISKQPPQQISQTMQPYGAKAFAELHQSNTKISVERAPVDEETIIEEEPPKPITVEPSTINARDIAGTQAPALKASLESAELTPQFTEQLDSIQKMLENLGRNRTGSASDEIPNELFHLYTELIDADVEDNVARDLIFRLRENCTPTQLSEANAAKTLLTAMVESEVRIGSPITLQRGARKIVALVGPTGVGKTTTIAKLAANFRLRDGVKMGLVTVDTYRIAAVEQLRTYAEIIDLPMKVVTNPLEMRRAIDELAGLDLILIDTAGRSPRDELQIQELKSLLAEADVDEVHLVLSMTSSIRSIQATAEKFTAANTTSLILTKLDEAAGMGGLLSVSRQVPLPISYLTTGQDVPDDIEPSNASRIARLILGEDRLFD